jgi:hypothetical protein
MKKRTFKDYIKEAQPICFLEYGRAFMNWITLNGYIDRTLSNSIYIFENDKLEVLNPYLIINPYSTEHKEHRKELLIKSEKFVEDIQEVGYRSYIYQDNLEKLTEVKDDLEIYFCNIFIELLFPKINYDRDIKKVSIEEVLLNFRERLTSNMLKNQEETIDCFMDDFSFFLENVPYPIEDTEYGYIFLKNIKNHDWEDLGVIIFNKTRLSSEILFYQIGDNN